MENCKISTDGKTIWINGENGCKIRLNKLDKLPKNMEEIDCLVSENMTSGFTDITIGIRMDYCENCGSLRDKLSKYSVMDKTMVLCRACANTLSIKHIAILPLEEVDENV